MTGLAVALVLGAAFMHATWNLLAKRAGGGAPFVCLFTALATLLYAPLAVAVILLQRPAFGPVELVFVVGSAVLHLAYYLLLQRGYRDGDLSVVYPLARGTGPVLATAAAILFLGERPTALALAGAALVTGGVFSLARTRDKGNAHRAAVVFGLLTGALIGSYTLWDKHAVSAVLISPILFDWAVNAGRTVLLLPITLRRWNEVKTAWRSHRLEAVGVAFLSPASYILILTAMVFTPVSYIAPAREVSILIGTVLGARLLSEGKMRPRILAAGAIVGGVLALAFG